MNNKLIKERKKKKTNTVQNSTDEKAEIELEKKKKKAKKQSFITIIECYLSNLILIILISHNFKNKRNQCKINFSQKFYLSNETTKKERNLSSEAQSY